MTAFSANETYLLQLVNRARRDPAGEAARDGIGLNDGLPDGTIDATPKQPLAPNDLLHEAARRHGQWMLDVDIFAHEGAGGSTPGDRMAAAGYVFTEDWVWAENLAWLGWRDALPDIRYAIDSLHEGLFESPGHRYAMLYPDLREAGLSQLTGPFTASGLTYNAVMITENFARSGSARFLTGVAFRDADGDRFYDPGEGLAGIAVSIDGTVAATTDATGLYVTEVVAGAHAVSFNGPGLSTTYLTGVAVGAANLEVSVDASRSPPGVAVANVRARPGEVLPASGLFSASDADGDPLNFEVWDDTADAASGQWRLDGVAQPARTVVGVAAAGLSRLTFQAGTHDDTLLIRATDGSWTSDWARMVVDSTNAMPEVTATGATVAPGAVIAASSLFSAADPEGDPLYYNVWDDTTDPASGQWVLGGVAQPARTVIGATPAELANLTFHAGSTADTLYVRAFDGFDTSAWVPFVVTTTPPTAQLGADVAVSEAVVRMTMTVTLDSAPAAPATLRWSLADGTARAADGDMPAGQGGTLTFLPGGPLSQTIALRVNDEAYKAESPETFNVVLSDPTGLTLGRASAQVTLLDDFVPTPASPLGMVNTTTGVTSYPALLPYVGPVNSLGSMFILLGTDDVVLASGAPNVFLRTDAGNDALSVTAGQNVMDGGTGSNFMTGGIGVDDFFVDARNAPSETWSTMVGCDAFDAITAWGIGPTATLDWQDGRGAPGYTGLTLFASQPGKKLAALTLAGFSTADLSNGRLVVYSAVEPVSGADYLSIFVAS